jgi:hypothetical protein
MSFHVNIFEIMNENNNRIGNMNGVSSRPRNNYSRHTSSHPPHQIGSGTRNDSNDFERGQTGRNFRMQSTRRDLMSSQRVEGGGHGGNDILGISDENAR